MSTAAEAAPLDEAMLVMDVANTLRHGIDTPIEARPSPGDEPLVQRLRGLYRQQGIEASDAVLREGIAAMADRRFVYAPPHGPRARLARLYVARGQWAPAATVLVLALLVGLGGYFLGYRPYREAQAEQARLELAQTLPAQMDALYQAIFDDTKVQTAADVAATIRDRGKDAAHAGDRAGAE